jgi:hypothetical protein
MTSPILQHLSPLVALLVLMHPATVLSEIEFTEEARQFGSGITFGASWGDFDGDGDPDLFVNYHYGALPSLYRNEGDQQFVSVFSPGEPWGGMTLPPIDSHGAAWADFDNNGTQDLLLQVGANSGNTPMNNRLFINQDGDLDDEAISRNLDEPFGRGRTPLWVDWDNDGRLDVLLSNFKRSDGLSPTSVFLQEDDGSFTLNTSQPSLWAEGGEYASIIHLADEVEPSVLVDISGYGIRDTIYSPGSESSRTIQGSFVTHTHQDRVFADLDGDLLTDVLVTQHEPSRSDVVQTSATSVAAAMLMWHQNPVTQGVTFRSPYPITITISGMPRNQIYAGAEGGTLPDSPTDTWTLDPNDWGGISEPAADENGFYIGYDASTETWEFFTHSESTYYEVRVGLESDGLIENLQNNGLVNQRPFWDAALLFWDGSAEEFFDATEGSGLDVGSTCQSIVAEDFDNDTDLDLYMTCTATVENADNMLFENIGDGEFALVPIAGGASGTGGGRSDVVVSADYDLDGLVDLFVTNGYGGAPFFENGVNQLFHNTTDNQNHWLEIDLVGVESNRDGLGARVVLDAGGVGQVRTRGGGMHNRAQNFNRLHFGLGSSDTIDSLSVYWPSGNEQHLAGVPADQVLTIIEVPEPGRLSLMLTALLALLLVGRIRRIVL